MELIGRIKNGVVVFEVPPPLAEGTEVRVQVAEVGEPGEATRSMLEILGDLVGTVKGPPDWAAEHDHYLYGTPKRAEHSDEP